MSLTEDLTTFVRTSLMRDGGDPPGHDDSLIDRGMIDSIGLMQLVTFIESRAGVRVPDAYLTPNRFETINAIARMIEDLRAAQRD